MVVTLSELIIVDDIILTVSVRTQALRISSSMRVNNTTHDLRDERRNVITGHQNENLKHAQVITWIVEVDPGEVV